MAEVSRRTLLATAVGIAGAAAIGAVEFTRGTLPSNVPSKTTGEVATGSFDSTLRGARTAWTVSYPPGADRHAELPVLVVLHGRGNDHRYAFSTLHLDRFQAEVVAHGAAPFAIASVDGGSASYWHPRASGNPAGMVVQEFLPVLADRGLRTERIGLLGWSMGGYGALYLAEQLGRTRCAVAIAESPALWHTEAQSASGAFDDASDFDRHSVFTGLDRLRGIELWIGCGATDGFAPITRELRAEITPTPAGGIDPGAHDATYWRSQAKKQLAFAGTALSR